jgi:hypothetical protein
MLLLQKWHNAGKMELALEAKGDELNQQQKLVKEKNYQMQSLHKNIRILNRTLADCSDVSLFLHIQRSFRGSSVQASFTFATNFEYASVR